MSTHRDRLAKCILEETLDSVGATRREFEVDPGYLPRADFCFLPAPPLVASEAEWPSYLRYLYRMVQTLCLFEIATNPPDTDEVLDFHCKQMNLRNRRRQQGDGTLLPFLWVLTCGRPVSAFRELSVEPAAEWPTGFYRAAAWSRMGFVVLPELEQTRETLVLRLMGPARVRDEALAEIRALPTTDPEYPALSGLVAELRYAIERDSLIPQEDREAFMTVARAAFEKFKANISDEAMRQGRDQGMLTTIQELWVVRFNRSMDNDLSARLSVISEAGLLRRILAAITSATEPRSAATEIHALLARG